MPPPPHGIERCLHRVVDKTRALGHLVGLNAQCSTTIFSPLAMSLIVPTSDCNWLYRPSGLRSIQDDLIDLRQVASGRWISLQLPPCYRGQVPVIILGLGQQGAGAQTGAIRPYCQAKSSPSPVRASVYGQGRPRWALHDRGGGWNSSQPTAGTRGSLRVVFR